MENEVKKEENFPLVSVIMITFNHEEYIEKSLMSVVEQQNDNYDLEILIVDDGSSDDTQKIILSVQERYPDLVFPTFKEHIGITAINKNLNEQIKKARGEYITFLAGDDYFIRDGLLKQLKAFKQDEKISAVIGEGRNFDILKNEFLDKCQEDLIVKMLKNNEMSNIYEYLVSSIPKLFIQGFMLKKDLLEAVDYFDETLIADDWVLNIKLFKFLSDNNKLAMYIEDEVFQHNFHMNNTTNNRKQQCPRIIQVLKKYAPKNIRKELLSEQYMVCGFYFLKRLQLVEFFKYFISSLPMAHIVIAKIMKKTLKKLKNAK